MIEALAGMAAATGTAGVAATETAEAEEEGPVTGMAAAEGPEEEEAVAVAAAAEEATASGKLEKHLLSQPETGGSPWQQST